VSESSESSTLADLLNEASRALGQAVELVEAPAGSSSGGGQRWDEANRRFTVWLPVDVIEALAERSAATGESKAGLTARLLRAGLAREERSSASQ